MNSKMSYPKFIIRAGISRDIGKPRIPELDLIQDRYINLQ